MPTYQLFGHAGVALDEAAKDAGIGGVEIAGRGDEQSHRAQVPHGTPATGGELSPYRSRTATVPATAENAVLQAI